MCGQVNIWSTTRRGMKPLLALPPTSLDHHRIFFQNIQKVMQTPTTMPTFLSPAPRPMSRGLRPQVSPMNIPVLLAPTTEIQRPGSTPTLRNFSCLEFHRVSSSFSGFLRPDGKPIQPSKPKSNPISPIQSINPTRPSIHQPHHPHPHIATCQSPSRLSRAYRRWW